MRKINYTKLIVSIIICLLAGIVGSVFTTSSVSSWYPTLEKPSFNPPGWLFGPVWTTLYILMGISLYLVWVNENKEKKKVAIRLFMIQLILNLSWSIIFFGFKSPLFALIEIIFLLIMIIMTSMRFYALSKPSAYLLLPYRFCNANG